MLQLHLSDQQFYSHTMAASNIRGLMVYMICEDLTNKMKQFVGSHWTQEGCFEMLSEMFATVCKL